MIRNHELSLEDAANRWPSTPAVIISYALFKVDILEVNYHEHIKVVKFGSREEVKVIDWICSRYE